MKGILLNSNMLKFAANSNTLFYIAYGLYYISVIIDRSLVNHSIKVFFSSLSILILIIKLCITCSNLKKITIDNIAITFVIISVASLAVVSKDYFLLTMITFALCINRDLSVDKILKITILLLIVISSVIVILSIIGLIPNISTPRSFGSQDRFAYGFEHSQSVSLFSIYIFFCYHSLVKKITIPSILLFTSFFAFLYLIFDSRNGLYSILLFYVFMISFIVFRNIFCANTINCICNLSYLIVITFIVCNIILLFLYQADSNFALLIDKVVTGRISLPLKTLKFNEPHLINIMSFSDYRACLRSTMDNGYYYVLTRYGYTYLLILLYLIFKILNFFKCSNNYIGCISVVCLVVSISLANTFSLFLPFFIISFYGIRYKYNKNDSVLKIVGSPKID